METNNGFHLIFMTETPFEGEGSSAEMIRITQLAASLTLYSFLMISGVIFEADMFTNCLHLTPEEDFHSAVSWE
jgi:hypothetical protein